MLQTMQLLTGKGKLSSHNKACWADCKPIKGGGNHDHGVRGAMTLTCLALIERTVCLHAYKHTVCSINARQTSHNCEATGS